MPLDFQDHFSKTVSLIDVELDRLLTTNLNTGEIERPSNLVKAMRHGVLNGGKRLRPFLVIEVGALFGASTNETLLCGCALECLHSYSLVHDDLPAMDDDDLRRGLPTVHKAFDEATAILAGDALLTVAFDILSSPECHPAADVRCELVSLLARAAGQGGMIGGQVLDIEAETSAPEADEIRILQSMKTGALIRFACEAGAVLGGASKTWPTLAKPSALHFNWPMTCLMSRLPAKIWANGWAKMLNREKEHWSAFMASKRPALCSTRASTKPKFFCGPLATKPIFYAKLQGSSLNAQIERINSFSPNKTRQHF
jgi:hypothetical protein